MSSLAEVLGSIDRLVHEPARLAILTLLTTCHSGDFNFLLRATGLTKGNLSTHLMKLEEGELIEIRKSFVGKLPHTSIIITDRGLRAVAQHWRQLERLRTRAAHIIPAGRTQDGQPMF